jgi:hypothetical protein
VACNLFFIVGSVNILSFIHLLISDIVDQANGLAAVASSIFFHSSFHNLDIFFSILLTKPFLVKDIQVVHTASPIHKFLTKSLPFCVIVEGIVEENANSHKPFNHFVIGAIAIGANTQVVAAITASSQNSHSCAALITQACHHSAKDFFIKLNSAADFVQAFGSFQALNQGIKNSHNCSAVNHTSCAVQTGVNICSPQTHVINSSGSVTHFTCSPQKSSGILQIVSSKAVCHNSAAHVKVFNAPFQAPFNASHATSAASNTGFHIASIHSPTCSQIVGHSTVGVSVISTCSVISNNQALLALFNLIKEALASNHLCF